MVPRRARVGRGDLLAKTKVLQNRQPSPVTHPNSAHLPRQLTLVYSLVEGECDCCVMTSLDQFLTQIGAAELSSVVNIPPNEATLGPMGNLLNRVQQEIDAVNVRAHLSAAWAV